MNNDRIEEINKMVIPKVEELLTDALKLVWLECKLEAEKVEFETIQREILISYTQWLIAQKVQGDSNFDVEQYIKLLTDKKGGNSENK
jgi:hypothetical protein